MKQAIYTHTRSPWKEQLHWFDIVDSTNTQAKRLAREGAPHGTVLIADTQTAGRGRMGRQFRSQKSAGIYLSVILRYACPPDKLMHLTCAAAVAMCDAVENTVGLRPGIKWINDLVHDKRKLGGILTELSVEAGRTEFAVVGIGINCSQQPGDFPPELQALASSLYMATGKPVDRAALAGAMIDALWQMDRALLTGKEEILARYRQSCITLGREVAIHRPDRVQHGTALDLDADGGLLVRTAEGNIVCVSAGEVSVRGLYGYI